MKTNFEYLRQAYGNHKAAAKAIGVSHSRYNEWRRYVDLMPARAKRQIEIAAEHARFKKECRCACNKSK